MHTTKRKTSTLIFITFLFATLSACIAKQSDCSKTPGLATASSNPIIQSLSQIGGQLWESLSDSQLTKAQSCLNDNALYKWHFLPQLPIIGTRDGANYRELSRPQLTYIDSMLSNLLSESGYAKYTEITQNIEGQLELNNSNTWSTDLYSMMLFGKPNTDGSWGLQIDGHHFAMNFVIHGDQVTMVPAFLGTHHDVESDALTQEEHIALALVQSLTPEQQTTAVISNDAMAVLAAPSVLSGGLDNARHFNYASINNIGLRAAQMSSEQKEQLMALIEVYVGNLSSHYNQQWLSNIESSLDQTLFAWHGSTQANQPAYYRVYNPHILIEFDQADELGHRHALVRSPSGQDYGGFVTQKNLPNSLRAHYRDAEHHGAHTH